MSSYAGQTAHRPQECVQALALALKLKLSPHDHLTAVYICHIKKSECLKKRIKTKEEEISYCFPNTLIQYLNS